MRQSALVVTAFLASVGTLQAADPARILTNHLGYDPFGPKRAVIQGTSADRVESCAVRTYPAGLLVAQPKPSADVAVAEWRDWRFWAIDFTDVQKEGKYVVECQNNSQTVRSMPFRVQKDILERATMSDVIAYFKAQRVTGAMERADRKIRFADSARPPIDASGGWHDASGDYGVHLSQLDFTSYFNNQQIPLAVYALGRTYEVLEARGDANFNQMKRRLIDETTYGADFLVRMHRAGRSFYQTINAPGPGKRPEDRRIGPAMTSFGIKRSPEDRTPERQDGKYEVSYRSGGGYSIAGLAIAARLPIGGEFDRPKYLKVAEAAFAFLELNNKTLLNDGIENIVDDYCALTAATELFRTTKKPVYATAAKLRADSLLARLLSNGGYQNYWRADDKDRPFFHPSDAGAPVVSLVSYYDLADKNTQARIKDAVRRSFEFELGVTSEVPNPFGLARQYVQSTGEGRRTEFFFPHDTEAAPWWQGENARLGSLATAARLALPLFADDGDFQVRLRTYALDQLNWILGLNPFDASMLHGSGRNNPEYGFFSSWQYTNFPGGIVNGITSGFKDDKGIDYNLWYDETGQDADWRWGEQWLPHSSWYLLAIASHKTAAPVAEKAVIGYIFVQDRLIDPKTVPAEKLTHINYAFANIAKGEVVEGFLNDAENFKILNGLKQRNPKLKVLISIGGWTWSGGFSPMALTPQSRTTFIDSAVAFMERHKLDGLDYDWEFPGQKGMGNPHQPEDKQNYTALLAESRAALDKAGQAAGKRYLLTVATQAAPVWLEHTEMGKAQASLDFVNLMAYDQVSPADPVTGHHSPLFTHPANPLLLSAASVITDYINAGVPPHKIVLGVPFYGKAWGNVGPKENGLYQPGQPPNVRLRTFYGELKRMLENKDGFVRHWDEVSSAPFLYNAERQLFVVYDDAQAVRDKGRYVVDRGLGGMMFWELGGDPQFELIEAMNQAMNPPAIGIRR